MTEPVATPDYSYRGASFGVDVSQSCKKRRLSASLPASDPWHRTFGCPSFDSSRPTEEADEALFQVQLSIQQKRRRSRADREERERLRGELEGLLREGREGESAVQRSLLELVTSGHKLA